MENGIHTGELCWGVLNIEHWALSFPKKNFNSIYVYEVWLVSKPLRFTFYILHVYIYFHSGDYRHLSIVRDWENTEHAKLSATLLLLPFLLLTFFLLFYYITTSLLLVHSFQSPMRKFAQVLVLHQWKYKVYIHITYFIYLNIM